MVLRQFLRQRRAQKRIAADDRSDERLEAEAGRAEYRSVLEQECNDSALIGLLEGALKLPGDIVECGVYRDASLRRIGKTIKEHAPEETVFGLDNFEVFSDKGVTNEDTSLGRSAKRLAGKFKDANDAPARLTAFSDAFNLGIELPERLFRDEAWPGATKAVDEFFGARGIEVAIEKTRKLPAWYLQKV